MKFALLAIIGLATFSGCCATACKTHSCGGFATDSGGSGELTCDCGQHGYLAGHLHARHHHGDLPPGEHVPLAKFHPLPTRPVFEPQPDFGMHAVGDLQVISAQPAEPEPTVAKPLHP